MALTEEQQSFADHLDEAGLGLIAAPVIGDIASRTLAHRPGALGAIGRAGGHFHEHYGPYSDLAGLGLLMPSVMHGIARKAVPEQKTASVRELAYAQGVADALAKLALDEQMSEGGYTQDEARRLFAGGRDEDLDEAHEGLNEELEHRDITRGDDQLTKQIVEAHLEEDPAYYTKLKRALSGGK